MKLGFVSAILDGWTFEGMVDTAAEMGYQCVEVACWPAGKAERRYAGVSHIDVDALDDEQVNYIHSYLKERGVEILSLIHISEPTRQAEISYAVFCLKKKNTKKTNKHTIKKKKKRLTKY